MTPPATTPDALVCGSTIQTVSGRYVDPLNLRPEDVELRDIGHALSNLCRFTGHVRTFYSVAEHSCRVAAVLENDGVSVDVLRLGLLHDASEAYLSDMSAPLKRDRVFGSAYRHVENRVTRTINEAFRLDMTGATVSKLHAAHQAIKRADLILLATERRDLMPKGGEWAVLEGVEPLPTRIVPAPPREALAAWNGWVRKLALDRDFDDRREWDRRQAA